MADGTFTSSNGISVTPGKYVEDVTVLEFGQDDEHLHEWYMQALREFFLYEIGEKYLKGDV